MSSIKEPLTEYQKQLVKDNFYLVERITKRWYRKTWLSYEQVYDCVINALIRTAQNFDESLGYVFSTYLGKVVENQVKREMRNVHLDIRKANHHALSFEFEYGNEQSTDNKRDKSLYNVIAVYDSHTLIDIEQLLNLLEPVERDMVEQYYLKRRKQREIAAQYGFTQAHVSRVIEKALFKIRKQTEGVYNG